MNVESQPLADGKNPDEGWSLRCWAWCILLALAAHFALIFIFGSKKPLVPRPVSHVPQIHLAGENNELVALTDPTLFVLPHAEVFSALAGQQLNALVQPSFRWTEPPPFLPISPAALGANFSDYMRTNQFPVTALDLKPTPQVALLFMKFESTLPQASTFRLAGNIAQRQLLNQIDVPSWPYNDVLKPSRVQVLVDENGNVVSDILLGSSEYAVADQKALELARQTRFAPEPGLMFGELIFNWHTTPTTNAP